MANPEVPFLLFTPLSPSLPEAHPRGLCDQGCQHLSSLAAGGPRGARAHSTVLLLTSKSAVASIPEGVATCARLPWNLRVWPCVETGPLQVPSG